ncbi:hypothetical protein MMC22_010492 [Lobaria immixta]|nr:hypothetical protein [Lobaria immixta]
MNCYLFNLPAELQLMIIKELVRNEHIEADASDYHHEDAQDEPIRIYLDLIDWSSTCSFFRSLLAPYIFKTVKLVNDEESGASLNAVAKSPYNVHVKELHFIGWPLSSAHSDEAAFPNTEVVLARSVNELLCDLQRFPSLERLSIKFDCYLMGLDWSASRGITASTPEAAKTVKAGASAAWLALMSRTYSTLTENKSPHFKHLEIRQLAWETVSIFSHAAFHDFLGYLEQFTLSIHGYDIDGGYMSNTDGNYLTAMTKLDEYFFNHLAKATTLSIKAPKEEPLGLEGSNYMPLLTTLHLDHVFISQDLIGFLVRHKDTLEELSLHNCYADPIPASIPNRDDNRIYWYQLFASLFSACPARLRRFELVDCEMPFPNEQELGEEESEKVRTILRQDPGRTLFAYAYLPEGGANLVYDSELGLLEFFYGDDRESWNQLIGLVERNAKEAAKSQSRGVQLEKVT